MASMSVSTATPANDPAEIEKRVTTLLAEMTLAEKVGQMSQRNGNDGVAPDYLGDALRAGRVGSVINADDADVINELQRIAVEESRLGIPLLIGRDVIHGFKTIMPIPLGQAASWNPDVVRDGARIAAREAAATGINWTFAPMIDITRDPRWGRIAESLGEDPFLASKLAVAMVQGFQGNDLAAADTIAATAKHFAGYGASESGKDYNTTNIPENELRNVHLKTFDAAVDADVATLMTSFSDLDGIPATASQFLLQQVLRDEWQFDGVVVSDWDSIRQLSIHGFTENDRESAFEAVTAGVNMEMHGDAYRKHLEKLVNEGHVPLARVDEMVASILRTKFRLGLFESPYADTSAISNGDDALAVAERAALESVVLLKNDAAVLPLSTDTIKSIAVIGPLADAPYEQLGTWVFDGDPALSVTGLQAITDFVGGTVNVTYARAMETSRSRDAAAFHDAVEKARDADVAVLFLGEEAILSGEAHSRANIDLPGAQAELVQQVRATGTPVVAVIMAGRPLTLLNIIDDVDAILYAWHPGTMGGPAIADLLFGVESPSGKLPVSFPRLVGQVPIYYAHKNTGKPPTPDTVVDIDDIDTRAPQTSFGMTAYYLDAGYKPLFEFGYGLSYTEFAYENIRVTKDAIGLGDTVTVSAKLTNTGKMQGVEIAQLYIRDLVGNVTRPVRELKGFKRVHLDPGQSVTVDFQLHTDDLAFYGRNMQLMTEPGKFHAWIGGSSETDLRTEFRIVDND
jgi:beta-glucosidase